MTIDGWLVRRLAAAGLPCDLRSAICDLGNRRAGEVAGGELSRLVLDERRHFALADRELRDRDSVCERRSRSVDRAAWGCRPAAGSAFSSPSDRAPAPPRAVPLYKDEEDRRRDRRGWRAPSPCRGTCTATRVEMCSTTERSCAMKRYVSPSSSCRSCSRLTTCACTETSSADTGSSSTRKLRIRRQRARDADALALSAGEFVRIAPAVIGTESDSL